MNFTQGKHSSIQFPMYRNSDLTLWLSQRKSSGPYSKKLRYSIFIYLFILFWQNKLTNTIRLVKIYVYRQQGEQTVHNKML